jgi:cytochrome P450
VSRLPGPGPVASLRLAPRLLGRPYLVFRELHERYGPVVEVGRGPMRAVFVFGAEANQAVLQGSARSLRWREALSSLIPIDGETALVVSDGDDHRRRRRLVQPAFSVRRIERALPTVATQVAEEVGGWTAGATVDVHAALRPRVLAAVIETLFGPELRARAPELSAQLEVGIAYVNRSPGRRFDRDWPGTAYRRAMRARRAADELIYAEITRRRSIPPAGTATPGTGPTDDEARDEQGDVLDALLAAQDGTGDGLTDEEVRDQVVSLIAAGFDTTSAAIAWTLHSVLADDHVLDRLRAEIAATVGAAPLTAEHLGSMTYLDAVVSESLRLDPPGPMSARMTAEDVTIAGHVVPEGTLVIYSAFEVQRDPACWPEPERFAPERWLPGDPLHRDVDPYAYVPFGGGYRRCIGFALATQSVKAATVEVLRGVELRALDGTLEPVGIATMSPRGGVRCEVLATRS